jgi:hypothetical protein
MSNIDGLVANNLPYFKAIQAIVSHLLTESIEK